MAMNDRLQNFAQIETAMTTIGGRIQRLGILYKEVSPRTTTDDALVDELIAAANVLVTAATALKNVVYDPTVWEDPSNPA